LEFTEKGIFEDNIQPYSTELMKEMENTMHGGSYPSLNKNDIQNFKIPVPPFAEQQKLVAEIEAIEAQIAINQQIINEAAAQKQAIMKKYL
jgi:restriction endonuclease S subunit